MNFKPPETDDEARTVKHHRASAIDTTSKIGVTRASISGSKQASVHRARSQLLISSPNRKCRQNCLKRASTARYQQMFHTAGRQRRMIRMSNGEPNNKGKHEALQTEARLLTSGKQVIQKRSGNRPQAIIHYPATRAQVKPSENHKACNKRCIALAVW
jgi:hypothetical protein